MILEEENPLQLPSPMAEARKHHKPSERGHKDSKQTSSPMTEASGASRTINRNCKSKKQAHKEAGNGSSWGSLRDLFSYRYQQEVEKKKKKKSCRKIGCSVSLCRMRDSSCVLSPEAITAQVNKKLALSSSCNSSSRSLKAPCNDTSGAISTSFTSNSSASITASSSSSSSSLSSSLGGSFGATHLRGFSGCYECHLTADPLIGPSREASMRLTISPCPDCGEIFMKPDDLELHHTAMHAGNSSFFSWIFCSFIEFQCHANSLIQNSFVSDLASNMKKPQQSKLALWNILVLGEWPSMTAVDSIK